jgi:hypothetical protein
MRLLPWTVLFIAPIVCAQNAVRPLSSGVVAPVSTQASIASTPDPAIAAVISAVMPRVAAWGPVKGAPFSATETTVHEQTLSDGTVIKSTVEVRLWRDSEGRMRAESALTSSGGQPGRVITVWNPLEGKAVTWVSVNQTANFTSISQLPEAQLSSLMASLGSGPRGAAAASASSQTAANLQTESLSVEMIGGLEATGTRATQVVPAGTVNNDRDFTVTAESWVSAELKTTVRQMTSDPRTGTVTTELSNIDRSEPDATLFKLPTGANATDLPEPTATGAGGKR